MTPLTPVSVDWLANVKTGLRQFVSDARGSVGPMLQMSVVPISVFGILVGKYLTFVAMWNEFVGAALAQTVEGGTGIFEVASFALLNGLPFFMSDIGLMFDPIDGLWILLAVSSAWNIASDAGEQVVRLGGRSDSPQAS